MVKNITDVTGTQKSFDHRANMCSLAAQGKWSKDLEKVTKFIYLISPNQINSKFYVDLKKVLKSNKVKYFQLRLKKSSTKNIILISKK